MSRQLFFLILLVFGFVTVPSQEPDPKPKVPTDYTEPVILPSGETVKKTMPSQISGGVLNGKARSLPKPAYPPAARAAGAWGAVTVRVLIDEAGTVISAKAVSGHELLRVDSELAAMQARFSPTQLEGVPVKVSGVITYNYVLPSGSTSGIPVTEQAPDDREMMWAMGMMFSLIKSVDSTLMASIGGEKEKEFDQIIKGFGEGAPDEMADLKPLFVKLANAAPNERPLIVDEILVAFRAKTSPDENWHVELGNHLGSVLAEMLRVKMSIEKSGFAGNVGSLRSELRKLDDKLFSAPTNAKPEMIEKFKKISVFAKAEDLGSASTLESLFSNVAPLFAVFDDE